MFIFFDFAFNLMNLILLVPHLPHSSQDSVNGISPK